MAYQRPGGTYDVKQWEREAVDEEDEDRGEWG